MVGPVNDDGAPEHFRSKSDDTSKTTNKFLPSENGARASRHHQMLLNKILRLVTTSRRNIPSRKERRACLTGSSNDPE